MYLDLKFEGINIFLTVTYYVIAYVIITRQPSIFRSVPTRNRDLLPLIFHFSH